MFQAMKEINRQAQLLGLGGIQLSLFQMATCTCIRCPQPYAQIRPRYADAMIATRIDFHIGRFRHVAFHAQRTGRANLVTVVTHYVVLTCRMLMAS